VEYRSRFGHLDYMSRRGPDDAYARDAGPPVRLPDGLEERCGFLLYPYVHPRFAEAVTWSMHEEAIEQLRAGAAHPSRQEVLELANLAAECESAWDSLADGEQTWVISREVRGEKPDPAQESTELRTYLELDNRVTRVARLLHAREAEKIRRALAELDGWLLAAT
jgi:hypothetical protein